MAAQISVIIPAYNAGGFIGAAIASALDQTHPATEIIVVDDASTDDTAAIARGFGPPVRCIRLEVNSGPGRARNVGVMASRGDILAMLDADDVLGNQHLAQAASLLQQWPQAGMVISSVRMIDAHGVPTGKAWALPGRDRLLDCENLAAAAMRGLFLWSGDHVFRREALTEIGGYDEMPRFCGGRRVQAEDNDVFLRLAVRFPCALGREPTVDYRVHARQASHATEGRQHLALFQYRMRLLERIQAGSPALIDYPTALERVRMGWAQTLEDYWARRDLPGLRVHVGYGLRHPLLRRLTSPYALKSRLPAAILPALSALRRLGVPRLS